MFPEPELSAAKVYRRLLRGKQYDPATQQVSPEAFVLREGEPSLSLYLSTQTTPKQVLEMVIAGKQALVAALSAKPRPLLPDEEKKLLKTERWLQNYPDAKAVYEDYRVMEIPVAAIEAMQVFRLENLREDGHIDLIGSYEDFQAHKDDFVNLLNQGIARVLTEDECLA